MQYFLKLLFLNQEPSILLFGFCAPTEQLVSAACFSDPAESEYENNKPVSKLHTVNECWDLDKALLIKKIEQSFLPYSGRELKSYIQKLMES